jgi:hypothetical protein
MKSSKRSSLLMNRALSRQLSEQLSKNEETKRPKIWGLIKDILGIISIVTTIYFAIVSINLTRKYGENKDQIERLTTISENQVLQLDKLIKLVDQQKLQSDVMNRQAEISTSLFTLNRNQYQEYKLNDSLLEIIDRDRVMDVVYGIFFELDFRKDSTQEKKIQSMKHCFDLLSKEKENRYLARRPDLYQAWQIFMNNLKVYFELMDKAPNIIKDYIEDAIGDRHRFLDAFFGGTFNKSRHPRGRPLEY